MFNSIRSKLRLMLLLLGIIIILIFVNYFVQQRLAEMEHDYAQIVEINNHFSNNLAEEFSSPGNPEEFARLKKSYRQLYENCLQCHDSNPGQIILTRNTILEELHQNTMSGVQLRKTINARLNELTESVRYIDEHHIANLKNILKNDLLQEEAYPGDTLHNKSSTKSAPELDIIQQTVAIQHSLSDIIRNFYSLKDTETPLSLQNEFFDNISRFYIAINTFESLSLDAQDGLLVEELLDHGRIFESSFSALIQLKETERKLFLELRDNQKKIISISSHVTGTLGKNRNRLNKQLTSLKYISFLFITVLLLLILRQGRTIVASINHFVTETRKIKTDYTYQIEDNPDSEEEFRILSRALNSMAENLNKRIIRLDEETKLRIQAETEKAETEIKLQRAKQKEAIGTLAGGIAHDFNNLLTAILGNINLATYSLSPDNAIYNNLVDAEKAAKRAHKLTKQLLTFSKGGAPVKETAPIDEVIRDSASFILHGSNVDCVIDIPKDLWLVKMDQGQIGQVIQNLVLNGDHAMADGGTINISCRNHSEEKDSPSLKKGSYIRVDIQDHGKGIPAEELSHIFDPYFTTKAKGHIKGSGLGLAIVHSIISKHGGYITVDSTVGKGTTITFFLPAVDEEPTSHQQTDDEVLLGHGKILVMDDETMIQDMTQYALSTLGYEIEIAENGEQALEMYDRSVKGGSPFDLVIMDLTIPGGMGGKEAAERILEDYPDARLLVSSGYAEDPIMTDPSKYGFIGSLQKPYEIQKLSQVLHDLIV